MNNIRPWLCIGKYRETLDLSLLSFYQVEAMLQMAELVEQPHIVAKYLPVEDGEPLPIEMLEAGMKQIKAWKAEGKKVMVSCGAGMSRSSTFCIAALKEIEGLGLKEAFRVVKEAHPPTIPHPALWSSLCAYYDEEVPWIEIA